MNIIYHIELAKAAFWSIIPLGFCLYFLIIRLSIRTASTSGNSDKTCKGWSVPTIDCHGKGHSFFHTWDVKIKLAALFTYCMAVAFLHRPIPALTALTASLLFMWIGAFPISRIKQRLSAITGFLSMFLLIMPLTAAQHLGDPIILIDPYHLLYNLRALEAAFVIMLKAAAIALMMEPLFNSAPLSNTINALSQLGLPTVICQMVLLSHRYIFVFLHEIKRMHTGMKVRGFRGQTNIETMRTIGNFIGMLMIRSVDRTERVYQAMLARGFQGKLPIYYEGQSRWHDWLKAVCFLLFGLFLLWIDRTGIIYHYA